MNLKYSAEEREAVISRYAISHESIASIALDTGIPRSTLYFWIKQHQEKQNSKYREITIKNYRLLENKVKRLQGIIEILKTANCTANAPLNEKLYALEELYGQYSVHMLCDALNVPRSTFYNHMFRNKRDDTWYAKRREELRIKIQKIYDDSNQIFGAAKITAVLKDQGERVSTETVRELMRDMGLISIRQESKDLYDKEKRRYKNYLNQQFTATAPNQIWVSDITYFRFDNKEYYICAILDLYARRIVAYRIGMKNSTQLVKSTFKLAYDNRKPGNDLIFHTDRGANYRSNTFCSYLKSLQVNHSYSRAYIPYDNSVMESFFASLKREELYRTKYRSENEFRTALDNYMIFYNERRPHAKNGYKTPERKEREYFQKQAELHCISN